MKRAVFLILLVIFSAAASLSAHGALSFVPVLSSSMKPILPSGSIVFVKPLTTTDFSTGDIIVFRVSGEAQDLYHYPPIAARRIIETIVSPSLGYIVSGDATGITPFTVAPASIIGTAGGHIPYLGLPMIFFQSNQDLLLAGIAYILLGLFLFRAELLRRYRWLRRCMVTGRTPARERYRRPSSNTDAAIEKFAAAMSDYAQHLASHTSAIQGLSEASQELKRGAAEQNRVLSAMLEMVGEKPLTVTETAASSPLARRPERLQAAEKPAIAPAIQQKRAIPKRKRAAVSSEQLVNSLLRHIKDVREASASAPAIPEVTFTESNKIKTSISPITPPPEPEPPPVPGCARHRPFKGSHPHAS